MRRPVRRTWILVSILVLAFGLQGQMLADAVAEPQDTQLVLEGSADFTTLNSTQLAAILESKDVFLVNVHVPYEGEIRNTDALIAFDRITENLDKLPPDKNAKIVLYCRSGRMSEIAAEELSRIGYSQVSHLSGGMKGWKENSYEIIEK